MRLLCTFILFSSMSATAQIPPNTWVQLIPEDCAGKLCSKPHPEYRAYSGSSVGNGYVWWWGGGHKAGPTNDIDAYNIDKGRWEQFTTAEDIRDTPKWEHLTETQKEKQLSTWGGGQGPMYWSPLGRFMTHHSYSWQLWHPVREEWCGLFPYPPKQYPVFVCYNPELGDEAGEPATSGTDPTQPDGAFQIISRNVPDWKLARHTVGLTWDSKRQQVVMIAKGRGNEGIYRFYEEEDEWVRVASALVMGEAYSEGYIDYHPGLDAYFATYRMQLNVVDAQTGEVRKISNPPTDTRTLSLEYSPELDRMLIGDTVHGVARLYAYNREADTWDRLRLEGTVPSDSTLGYDLLDRDPRTGQYFVIRDANSYDRKDGMYTFRLTAEVLDRKSRQCPYDICVGTEFDYASIQNAVNAASPGDVIGVASGNYEECVVVDQPVTIRAIKGTPYLHGKICDTKGVIVNRSEGTVEITGLEVSAESRDKAIWHHNGAGTLVLRDIVVHDADMGVFSGPGAESLQIYDSEIYDIGVRHTSSYSHFIYGGESMELIVKDSHLHGGVDGHLIKAKSVDVLLEGNVIEQKRHTDFNLVDVWGCGENVLRNNRMVSADTREPVIAVGITRRTREDKPCPVETATFLAEGNTYMKKGRQGWSRFVDNRYLKGVPVEYVTLADNDVTNAVYYRDANREFETEKNWLEFWEHAGAESRRTAKN